MGIIAQETKTKINKDVEEKLKNVTLYYTNQPREKDHF